MARRRRRKGLSFRRETRAERRQMRKLGLYRAKRKKRKKK